MSFSNYDIDSLLDEASMYFAPSDVSSDKPVVSNVCNFCNSKSLKIDYSNGMIICTDCGVVNEHNLIDDSPEWNFGQEDAMFGKDPARCGCPMNPLLEQSSMSTVIGKGGGSKFWLLRKIHQQNSMNYLERARYHTFEHINMLTCKADLPVSILNKAKYYYKELSNRKLSRGAVRQGLIACCIYYACKMSKVSRSVREIADMCEIDVMKVNSSMKIFNDVMKDIIKDESSCNEQRTNADDLINRYCNVLNIQHSEQYKIGNYVRRCNQVIETNKMLVGKTPSAITSALIYFVIHKLNYIMNKKQMCDLHKISVVTLNKIVSILEENSVLFEQIFCK